MPSREKPETQGDKFVKTAKDAGCEDNEEAFDAALKRIAKAPVPDKKPDKRGK